MGLIQSLLKSIGTFPFISEGFGSGSVGLTLQRTKHSGPNQVKHLSMYLKNMSSHTHLGQDQQIIIQNFTLASEFLNLLPRKLSLWPSHMILATTPLRILPCLLLWWDGITILLLTHGVTGKIPKEEDAEAPHPGPSPHWGRGRALNILFSACQQVPVIIYNHMIPGTCEPQNIYLLD